MKYLPLILPPCFAALAFGAELVVGNYCLLILECSRGIDSGYQAVIDALQLGRLFRRSASDAIVALHASDISLLSQAAISFRGSVATWSRFCSLWSRDAERRSSAKAVSIHSPRVNQYILDRGVQNRVQ
jgi:hypothetical protein